MGSELKFFFSFMSSLFSTILVIIVIWMDNTWFGLYNFLGFGTKPEILEKVGATVLVLIVQAILLKKIIKSVNKNSSSN